MMADAGGMTELRTERLRLRRFRDDDAAAFVSLAGDLAVARMTSDIPHPLREADAGPWLRCEPGEVRFAIEYEGRLGGGAGYFMRPSGAAELGFWLGRHLWGVGIATEAAREVVRYGFTHGGLEAFTSSRFIDNPASERVLTKLGFQPIGEGLMWCTARNTMVATIEYWLPRADRAARTPAGQRRWRALLGRVLGPQ